MHQPNRIETLAQLDKYFERAKVIMWQAIRQGKHSVTVSEEGRRDYKCEGRKIRPELWELKLTVAPKEAVNAT